MVKIPKDNPERKYVEGIHESGRRAAAVVADLLTISRDAATDTHIANLNEIMQEYLASPEHQSLTQRFPEIEFKAQLAEDLLNHSCSVIHMKKCIMNLTINAAEATQSGVVILRTSNREITGPVKNQGSVKPGQYIMLSVIDDGPGISSEDIDRIFEPFYTKKKMGHSGTGFGLTVVWSAVQEHQGFVEIKQPGVGSIFELYFPASEEQVQRDDLLIRNVETEGKGEHVLVIDDEEPVRILAERLLIDLGYRVSMVSSGEEAISFLKDQKVDLLLLDMLMEPGLSGYETYKKIKAFMPNQKALITSGFSESRDVKRAKELGAGGYLRKPYTLMELGRAVRKEFTN